MAATAGLASLDDDHVSDFARPKTIAVIQVAIGDNTGPNAAPYHHDDQIRAISAAAKGVLGQGGYLAIVSDIKGQVVLGFQQISQREILPVKVDRVTHNASRGIHQPRRPNADSQNWATGHGYQLV